MNESHRVLWGEGMLLTPQHFQQWDRHHRAVLRERIQSVRTFDWGLAAIQIDEEALLGGHFGVRGCAGVFSDGTTFDAPRRDRLPGDRPLSEAQDAARGVIVHLAIPISRSGGLVCGDDAADGMPTPYVRDSRQLPDETKVGSDRDVQVALANLTIRFEGEPQDDYQTLPIARVIPAPTGGFQLDPNFVPACQYVSASPFLVQSLRRTVEILTSRSADLGAQQRKSGGMAEVAGFWLLHTFHSHLPALIHALETGRIHPEFVFLEYARLAAELCTFAEGFHVRDLPTYDHADLTKTFGELDEKLRQLLDTVVPSRCVQIPLDQTTESLFTTTIQDDRVLKEGQIYVGVLADMDEDRLLVEFPGKSKISSRERVQQLLTMAMPGIGIKHVPVPPPEIPVQPGRVYFQFIKAGEHWDAIAESRTLAMHVPPDFPGLRLEVMSVKE